MYDSVAITTAGDSFIKTIAYDSWQEVDIISWAGYMTEENGAPYRLIAVQEQEPIYR